VANLWPQVIALSCVHYAGLRTLGIPPRALHALGGIPWVPKTAYRGLMEHRRNWC